MGRFFIDTDSGQVATHGQLLAAGMIADGDDAPVRPWHPVQGSPDASTLWFAVMRKKTRGVFIGTLVLRHGDHHASLLADGWEDIAMDELRDPAWPDPVGEANDAHATSVNTSVAPADDIQPM